MDGPGARIALVGALVVGAAVWAFTTSPGLALLALLAGLVVWEWGRRSRYRRRLRFAVVARPPKGRARPGRSRMAAATPLERPAPGTPPTPRAAATRNAPTTRAPRGASGPSRPPPWHRRWDAPAPADRPLWNRPSTARPAGPQRPLWNRPPDAPPMPSRRPPPSGPRPPSPPARPRP